VDVPPRAVLLHGTEAPPRTRTPLRAGPLTLLLEAGDLRYVRLGDREVLRQVYVAVRDRNWDTVPGRIGDLRVERGERSFRVTYDSEHRQGDVDFFWRATITGSERGEITFSMDGEARSAFLRNRIGFCVLHPVKECAGVPFRATKADGSAEQGRFPLAISPHQPVTDLRAIAHEVLPGVRAEVRFGGEVFEMEDHRNWTDASYKTYGTPLRLPFPVRVERGARIAQTVTLALEGEVAEAPARETPLAVTVAGSAAGPLPRIGLGLASHDRPLSLAEAERLKALALSHLRVDLALGGGGWRRALARAVEEAHAVGAELEVALHLTDAADAQLDALAAEAARLRPPAAHWLVFKAGEKSTTERWVDLARRRLGAVDPRARIGAGTNAYFAELNRGRPPVHAADLVCWSVNPQVHATDDATLVENVEAQAWAVQSAREFCAGLPLAVTPVTLRPRFNPNATGGEPPPGPDELPAQVDPRQMSLLGAGWTVGSVKYLAESGAASVTYYETTGWRGVMETEAGSPRPGLFPSSPGAVFPLYHVLADVGEFAGGAVVPTRSTDTLTVEALALERGGRRRVLLANLSGEPRRVEVLGLPATVALLRLDETTAPRATEAPEVFRAEPGEAIDAPGGRLEVTLAPYAVVRIDGPAAP
jgi:hypothetical protein